jgi:predicted porin
MKFRLATLALLAATSAHAEPGVTLWGIVDAWVGHIDNKVGPAPTGKTTQLESGGAQASRWGLRGEEDLGGGNKVRFVLEQGITIDNGMPSNTSDQADGFNRNAYVGLASKTWGELRLGRMLTAYDAWRGSNNQLYDSSGFASTGQVWRAGSSAGDGLAAVSGSDYLARGNKTVYYRTPKLGAFIASASFTLGEQPTTATRAPRLLTWHVEYRRDPLRVGYAYQREKFANGDNLFHLLGASYKFGELRMVANAQRQIDERVAGRQKSDEYQIGLDHPFGAATVALGYARAITKDAGGRTVTDADGISAMATYDLSKRTRLYAAARRLTVDRADSSAALDQLRYGVGMTHKF